jgi:hypothetical protein
MLDVYYNASLWPSAHSAWRSSQKFSQLTSTTLEGVPKLKPGWRWEDQERALLTSCPSSIAIVDAGLSRVVQFSHFSVKEYLTSARLATSSQDVSRYHIVLEPAHTIMAQACVSVLLQLDDRNEQNDAGENAPLAGYAANYWVNHAQFEDVVSRIKGIEYLFDWTNHILLLGASCMTWMPILLRAQSFICSHPSQYPMQTHRHRYTMQPYVDFRK